MKICFLLLVFLISFSRAEEPLRLRMFEIVVPQGYKDVPGRGIDSATGHYLSPDGLEISYDLGTFGACPERLSRMSKDELTRVVFYEDHPENAPDYYLIVEQYKIAPEKAPVHFVILAIGSGHGSLVSRVTNEVDLKKVMTAMRSIHIKRK